MDSDKIYPASPRKRKETKESGQVAKSTELVSLIVISSCFIYVYLEKDKIFNLINQLLNLTYAAIDNKNMQLNISKYYIGIMIKYLLPLFLILLIAAFLGNYIQVGFMLSFKAIEPKSERISMINGFKKMFSKDSFVNLGKEILKLAGVILITYSDIKKVITKINYTYTENFYFEFNNIFKDIFSITIKIFCFLLVLSTADYMYKKFSFEKNLKMTREEMMEELKRDEGNPQIKRRQKEIAIMIRRKQIKKVKDATVLIVNPTHVAVALKYDPVTTPVPILLFKGLDDIALEAKKLARENNIPIVENKPLAREIYAKVKEDDIIPQELFNAVAVVISYVYKLNNETPNINL